MFDLILSNAGQVCAIGYFHRKLSIITTSTSSKQKKEQILKETQQFLSKIEKIPDDSIFSPMGILLKELIQILETSDANQLFDDVENYWIAIKQNTKNVIREQINKAAPWNEKLARDKYPYHLYNDSELFIAGLFNGLFTFFEIYDENFADSNKISDFFIYNKDFNHRRLRTLILQAAFRFDSLTNEGKYNFGIFYGFGNINAIFSLLDNFSSEDIHQILVSIKNCVNLTFESFILDPSINSYLEIQKVFYNIISENDEIPESIKNAYYNDIYLKI